MNALQLCELAWKGQEGYVSFSTLDRKTKTWKDHLFKYPDERPKIVSFIAYARDADEEVYFAPAVFGKKARDAEAVLSTRLMWADADTADLSKIPPELKPTVIVESSPGKHQTYWLTKKPWSREHHDVINQKLTYKIGADKGGWGITKVLRLPGTRNHKYPDKPKVKVIHANGHVLSNDTILSLATTTSNNVDVPDTGDVRTRLRHLTNRYPISGRAKQLLSARPQDVRAGPEGHRSETLWELNCLLAEAGLPVEDIVALVKGSSWNKYTERADENRRLITEANKAIEWTADRNGSRSVSPRDVTASDSLEEDARGPITWDEFDRDHVEITWLIADIWGDHEVGFISGTPKSYKSWIALDLAVSVATGTRFLGSFQARQSHILLVQEEDPKMVLQDRLSKIAAARNLISAKIVNDELVWQYSLPDTLHIISNQGFQITDPEWLEDLETWIRAYNIEMVILDPLMMMAEGFDEFKAFETMSKVLKPLKQLRNRTGCSICIVHHHTKGQAVQADDKQASATQQPVQGARSMYGSVALWAWEESALHLEVLGTQKVRAERFSKHHQLSPLVIELNDDSDVWWPVIYEGKTIEEIAELITSEGKTLEQLVEMCGIKRDRLKRLLDNYVKAGRLTRTSSPRRPGQTGRPPYLYRVAEKRGNEELDVEFEA